MKYAHLILVNLVMAASAPAAISLVAIHNDADSGISSGNSYTHALDFGNYASGAVINGVSFTAYNKGMIGTLNFSYSVAVGSGSPNDGHSNTNHGASGGLGDLLTKMFYNAGAGAGITTMELTGLTAGQQYDLRIYSRRWQAGNAPRSAIFEFEADGEIVATDKLDQSDGSLIDPSFSANELYYISYTYTAGADGKITVRLDQDTGNSWHLYGLTNQVIPEPGSMALLAVGALGLLRRRR